MKWTDEQTKAIETKGSNIIVSAGAGSGKTAVLTARTIRNLHDFNIDKMIILTFTKAAAFSMKAKIKKALEETDDEKAKESLKNLNQAYICTFDAFSLDLVKKYSDLLNIDSDISIADSVLISTLKDRIIDEVFLKYYANPDFLAFLDTYTVKDDKAIKNDFKTILNSLDKLYNPEAFLDTYFEEFTEVKCEGFIQEYKALLTAKYALIKEKYAALSEIASSAEEKFLVSLDCYMHFKTIEEFFTFNSFSLTCHSKDESFKEVYAELKDLINEFKNLAIYESEADIKEELDFTIPYIKVSISLLKDIIRNINAYKKEHNLYEFNDITRLAIKIFEENEDIRLYYKETIKEIMIDEYQDTNDIGDYFISLIANNNVFMVGDVKQSIYRFRNANPRLFMQKYHDYSHNLGGIKIDLKENFRSRREVIANFNLIFSNIMTEDFGGAAYVRDHQMVFGQKSYLEQPSSNLTILNYNKDDYQNFKEPEIEAFTIALDIKKKIQERFQIFDLKTNQFREFKYSDACILLATKREFELYQKVFNYFKIPLTIHKDEDLTYAEELIFIKNVIKLVGYYQNINLDNALIKTYMSVARSFVLKIPDAAIFKTILASKDGNLFDHMESELLTKISYLSDFSKNHSITELVFEVLNVFQVYLHIASLGNRDLISYKIDHLIEITLSLERSDYHLEEFIAYLNDATDEDIDFKMTSNKSMEESVNIMSIHKSKGLDFNVCYFADLNKKFSIQEIKSRFLFSPTYGFIFPAIKEGIKPTICMELYKNAYLKEEISERIRVFYVALTRTREKMIFVTNLEENSKKIEPIKFRSFKDILESIKSVLEPYIVEMSKLELTRDYEKIQIKGEDSQASQTNVIDFTLNHSKVMSERFANSNLNLMDNRLLEFGTKIHESLEYLDFNNFEDSLANLQLEPYLKNKLKNLKNKPFIKQDAIYHKEYEFINNDNNTLKHGIIDLLVETDFELIVVDYKLNEINKTYYFEQVKGYMEYLKSISSKKISGYLYSILEETYLKVE